MRLLPIRLPNNVRPLLQVCVFGIPAAGAWIDRQERLRVMRITFIVNNLCVVGSACLMPALSNAVLSQDWGPELVYAVFAGGSHPAGLCGGVGRVCDVWAACSVCRHHPARLRRRGDESGADSGARTGLGGDEIQPRSRYSRDAAEIRRRESRGALALLIPPTPSHRTPSHLYSHLSPSRPSCLPQVPTMCDGDSALLTHLNTTMRRIDLSAKILAPTMVGVVLQYAAHDSSSRVLVGAILLGGFHALAWPLEVLCANAVYAAHEGTLEAT